MLSRNHGKNNLLVMMALGNTSCSGRPTTGTNESWGLLCLRDFVISLPAETSLILQLPLSSVALYRVSGGVHRSIIQPMINLAMGGGVDGGRSLSTARSSTSAQLSTARSPSSSQLRLSTSCSFSR